MKKKKLLLVTLPLVVAACSQQSEERQVGTQTGAIINGTVDTPQPAQFPSVVRLKGDDIHCSGVLVTRRHVVTAASCFTGVPYDSNGVHPLDVNDNFDVIFDANSTGTKG